MKSQYKTALLALCLPLGILVSGNALAGDNRYGVFNLKKSVNPARPCKPA